MTEQSEKSNSENVHGGQPPHRFSAYFYNSTTYFGLFLAGLTIVAELLLFGIDFFSGGSNIYLAIFTYLILPPFLIGGLFLIPVGALWKRRRVALGHSQIEPKSILIDPTNPEHRNAIFVFSVGTTIVLVMTAIGSYKAFQYSESVKFCGTTCHDVMKPQYTAYQHSPHANVKCVECHIGPGADWYVRSKMSGLRQVFKTIQKSYPKPIPTPVKNLRPAKETCEHCHWPGQFYSSVEMKRTYYPSSADKEKWSLRMLLPIGRSENSDAGIHAHMYIDHDIYYAAEDEKRQDITWVKSVAKDGQETVYVTDNSVFKDKAPLPSQIRKMDCMDCHNRPSHHYRAPDRLINQAMVQGKMPETLPGLKEVALKLLSQTYETEQQAIQEIRTNLLAYYQENYPEVLAQQGAQVDQAATTLVDLFQHNFFPEMKARWDAYPDNIGHMNSPGCFRCHDEEHKSVEGKVITQQCDVCHTIIEQGPASQPKRSVEGLEFEHPFEDDGLWRDMKCFDCHTGGAM